MSFYTSQLQKIEQSACENFLEAGWHTNFAQFLIKCESKAQFVVSLLALRSTLLQSENVLELGVAYNNAFCFSFQIRNPILYEVNGTSQYCKSRYSTGSLKISPVSEELGPLLERPIEFEYKEGKVGKIYCEDEEPEYILNIKRGILSILHHNFTKPELSVDNEEPRMYKNWEVVYFL